ncbi:ParE family toxin-like protein [Vibrio parahaemolyticus]|uniref:ParE family toxin-like protein n=1 Tax=Vibrio parahaemolyticus TaxID=670 RepID=UPI00403B0F67
MGKHLSIKLGNLPRTFKKSLSGLPPDIAKKAKSITQQIASGTPTGDFDAKRLTINRKVMSFKVGSRYRMLMAETSNGIEPWMCVSHEDYNKLYMRISTS